MKFLLIICSAFITIQVYSQEGTIIKKLPKTINRYNTNNSIPVLSGDGRFMIYRSNLSQDGDVKIWYTKKSSSGKWGKQEVFDQTIDQPNVNTFGGYFLSYDGKTMAITSRRHGGIGRFDIWITEKKGNGWGTLQNAGKPLNTLGHEGDPTLSPDGRHLYFMRCHTLTETEAKDCKILVAERKPNGYFKEPIELPPKINLGNTTSPLILADNKTLIFASDRTGGKDGLDLYLTRKEGDNWSEPKPMDYLNTEKDDRYLSIPVRGDIAFFTKNYDGYDNIVMAIIPEELQQRKVIWVEGKVTNIDTGEPLIGVVQIQNTSDKKIQTLRVDDNGRFTTFLTQGVNYDMSVIHPAGKYSFDSKFFELQDLKTSKRERIEFNMKELAPNTDFVLNNISFEQYTAQLSDDSEMELKRLIFLMKKNQDLRVEIGAHIDEYKTDSIQSDSDLTEVIIDTVMTYKLIEKVDTVVSYQSIAKIDSVLSEVNSISMDTLQNDTLVADSIHHSVLNYDVLITYDTLEMEKIQYTYHNDRTTQQAQAMMDYLLNKGVPPGSLVAVGYKDERPLFPNDTQENRKANRRIEVKFF